MQQAFNRTAAVINRPKPWTAFTSTTAQARGRGAAGSRGRSWQDRSYWGCPWCWLVWAWWSAVWAWSREIPVMWQEARSAQLWLYTVHKYIVVWPLPKPPNICIVWLCEYTMWEWFSIVSSTKYTMIISVMDAKVLAMIFMQLLLTAIIIVHVHVRVL